MRRIKRKDSLKSISDRLLQKGNNGTKNQEIKKITRACTIFRTCKDNTDAYQLPGNQALLTHHQKSKHGTTVPITGWLVAAVPDLSLPQERVATVHLLLVAPHLGLPLSHGARSAQRSVSTGVAHPSEAGRVAAGETVPVGHGAATPDRIRARRGRTGQVPPRPPVVRWSSRRGGEEAAVEGEGGVVAHSVAVEDRADETRWVFWRS